MRRVREITIRNKETGEVKSFKGIEHNFSYLNQSAYKHGITAETYLKAYWEEL